MKKFIVVAGNIGIGKTSLVNSLSQELGWKPFIEAEAENPYLPDFYKDMSGWAFHSQIFFLTHRLKMHREINQLPEPVVLDRSIYEDAEIFARNLWLNGYLAKRDFDTYCELYQTTLTFLKPPDLVIYLRGSVELLQKRILKRNRNYEKQIPQAYLEQLNILYEKWISDYTLSPVLTIPAGNLDFVERPEHLALITSKVQEKLTGKDIVTFSDEDLRD